MDQFLSQKFRFYSFLSMTLLVFVHGYNLNVRYLQPFTIVNEHLTVNAFLQYFLANGIFRFRIPMLFIISGYLFASRDTKPYGERVKRRLQTLLVPYLLWSAIGILVTFLFEQWAAGRAAVVETSLFPFADKRIAEYSIQNFLIRWILAPIPFQLWFIRCLLIYNLMYPWLKTAVTKIPIVFFTVAGILWVMSFFAVFIEGEGLLFFSLGIWIFKTNIDVQKRPAWYRSGYVVGAWVGVAAFKTWLAFNGQLGDAVLIPVLIILYKFVVLGGLVAVWYSFDPVVKFFMNRPWFVRLSAFSFIIYALHAPLISYATNFAFAYANVLPHYRLLTFIFLPSAVISACVLIGATLRLASPQVYGLLTGGRGLV
jgi:fucose 4-O-acetylase-like acetyltransferase